MAYAACLFKKQLSISLQHITVDKNLIYCLWAGRRPSKKFCKCFHLGRTSHTIKVPTSLFFKCL